jgi:hypothetical protein
MAGAWPGHPRLLADATCIETQLSSGNVHHPTRDQVVCAPLRQQSCYFASTHPVVLSRKFNNVRCYDR